MTEPQKQTLKIADLTDDHAIIADHTFEDRLIVGPAVLVPMGAFELFGCIFPGPAEHFVWLLPEHPVFGPIGVRNCRFRNCQFTATVAIAADAKLKSILLDDLLR